MGVVGMELVLLPMFVVVLVDIMEQIVHLLIVTFKKIVAQMEIVQERIFVHVIVDILEVHVI